MTTKARMAITSTLILALAVVGIVVGVYYATEQASADDNGRNLTTSSVHRITDASAIAGTTSTLVRTKDGITGTVQTSELEAGNAYSLWWVIFNNPKECEHPVGDITTCGEGDIFAQPFGETPVQVSVQYAAGNVVGGTGTGNFGAHLNEGELPAGEGQLVFGPGLINSDKAEVHLVVRNHGNVIPPLEEAQITTFGGACTAETDPTGVGPEGPNDCADIQFAAHLP